MPIVLNGITEDELRRVLDQEPTLKKLRRSCAPQALAAVTAALYEDSLAGFDEHADAQQEWDSNAYAHHLSWVERGAWFVGQLAAQDIALLSIRIDELLSIRIDEPSGPHINERP